MPAAPGQGCGRMLGASPGKGEGAARGGLAAERGAERPGWWIAAPPPARVPGRGGPGAPGAGGGAGGSGAPSPPERGPAARRMSCGQPKDMEGTGHGRGSQVCRGTQLLQPLTRRERPWGLSHPSRGCPPSSLRRCPLHPVGLPTLQPRRLSPLSRGMPSTPSPALSCPSRGSAPPHPPFLPSASRGGSVPSLYPQCNGVPVKWTGKFGWGGMRV